MFEPEVWDVLIVVGATYVAVLSLVRMMKAYRLELIQEMRLIVLERRGKKKKKKTSPEE